MSELKAASRPSCDCHMKGNARTCPIHTQEDFDAQDRAASLSVDEQIALNHLTGDYRRCPGHGRHWFVYRGYVGSSSPSCVRCGAPNPAYRPADDPFPESTP